MAEASLAEVQGAPVYSLSNKIGRVLLLAMEDVMGRNGANAVLNLARLQERVGNYPPNDFAREFSFDEMGQLLRALDEMYGQRSGRSLARRIGRACFRVGIADFGPVLGVAGLFRFLPLTFRLRLGLHVLSQMLTRFTDQMVRLEEDGQYLYWVMDRCGVCWGRASSAPICHLAVGLLEEELYWISGGKTFYVEEVTCIAAGERACTILIGKSPLD